MRRIGMAVVVATGAAFWAATAFAQGSCGICNAAGSESYPDKTVGQLARGVANVGLSWVELVNQPMKEMSGGGNIAIGVGKGIGHTCLRIAQGAGEIITSPMPRAKDGKFTQIADGCPLGVIHLTDR